MAWETPDPSAPETAPPNIAAIFRRQAEAALTLGQEILAFDRETGAVRMAYHAGAALKNRFGMIHGGMIAGLMDDAMAVAAGLTLNWGELTPTLSMTVNYVAMAGPGRLLAQARTVKRGRTVMFLDATLTDDGGKLIATAVATCAVTQSKPKG
jgi:uncharacterized protein (TIGR00369 family)